MLASALLGAAMRRGAAPSARRHALLLHALPREDDERFMRLALEQATVALQAGEVPIGAVLAREGECLTAECNRVEELQDASAHAEMNCLRAGAAALGNWRLLDTTLYVTVEPCPMCMAAIQAFRVRRLVYGTINTRLGAVEGGMAATAAHPYHSLEITRGVMADEAAALMKSFFSQRRAGGVPPPAAVRPEGPVGTRHSES